MSVDIVIGIDIGTQGVRVLAVDHDGRIVASASEKFALSSVQLPTGWAEQDALTWWSGAASCLRQLTGALPPDATTSYWPKCNRNRSIVRSIRQQEHCRPNGLGHRNF